MIFHRTKILSVHLSVVYPGEGPPYFKTKWNWGPQRPKKNFFDSGSPTNRFFPQLSYLNFDQIHLRRKFSQANGIS